MAGYYFFPSLHPFLHPSLHPSTQPSLQPPLQLASQLPPVLGLSLQPLMHDSLHAAPPTPVHAISGVYPLKNDSEPAKMSATLSI